MTPCCDVFGPGARGSKVKALVAAPGIAATNLAVTTAADGGMSDKPPWILGLFVQSAARA